MKTRECAWLVLARMRRGALASMVVAGVLVLTAPPAAAHGGSSESDASNYRSRVVAIAPDAPALRVTVIDTGARLQLDYTGPGEVLVLGYRGEPYLRVSPLGVEENLRSPATYLNVSLTGSAPVPDYADPQAEPEWRRVSTTPRARWHDHRAHWMSNEPPPAVQLDRNATYVIFDPWVVPVLVDGAPIEVRGDLTWVPPPNAAWWWATTAIAFAALVGAFLWRSHLWLRMVALLAGLAGDFVGTTGRFLDSSESTFRRYSLYLYAVLIVAGLLRGAVHLRRRHRPPVLAIGLAGLVVGTQAGIARITNYSYSQLPSTMPGALERLATVVCVAVGWSLLADFLWTLRGAGRDDGPPRRTTGQMSLPDKGAASA